MTTTNFIKASLLALLTITLFPVKLILSALGKELNIDLEDSRRDLGGDVSLDEAFNNPTRFIHTYNSHFEINKDD